jgi:nucleotide-binding universal stress UspA family protein
MKPVVVGVDGSRTASHAFRWGAKLAAASQAELRAVASFVPEDSELPPGRVAQLREAHERSARGWCDAIADEFAVSYLTEVADGDPRQVLHDAALAADADALVVGSVGRSGAAPGWLRIGSVAEHLAHNSAVPLVVVPPDREPAFDRLVVAVDGSRNAAEAAGWCGRVAAATGAKVNVVAVARRLVGGWETIPERKLRDEWVAGLVETGADVDFRVVQDTDAANGILTTAQEIDADLLVVGMRGLGGFLGLRAGGVAMKVLHRANTVVALVPPG